MRDASMTHTVSFQNGDGSILGKSKNTCSGRPDANTLIFEAGGKKKSVVLNTESQEGIEAFMQQSKQLLRRGEAAHLKQMSRGTCGRE